MNNIELSSPISNYTFLILYIVGKSAMSVNYNFLYLLLFEYADPNSQGPILAFTKLIYGFTLSLMPYYN